MDTHAYPPPWHLRIGVWALLLYLENPVHAVENPSPWKLRFSHPGELIDTWGALHIVLQWGTASIRQLAGKSVRLRFRLRSATLFAVGAAPQP